MERLSVILVTLNEEKNIDRCLGSVRWADEIVVVDSFSTDRTVELARQYTDKVYQHEYPGTSKQVERGISYATGDWIFVIDADEEMSAELAAEVQGRASGERGHRRVRVHPQASAFGRWIEHGGWFPDYQFRFFRKDSYYPEHQEIHGGFNTKGKRGRLNGYSVSSHVCHDLLLRGEDERVYVPACLEQAEGQPAADARWHNLILNPLSHFLRMFISKKGYKDGFHGFVLAAAGCDVHDAALRASSGNTGCARRKGRARFRQPQMPNSTS